MWFKQLSIYPLNKDNLPNLETLVDKLTEAQFKPCMGLDWDSIGFASPVSFSPEMVFPAQNTWRIALKKEEKVLPAAVVRDILDEKINEIREAEGRNVGRKEKMELKETITDDLLPRAFTKSGKTEAIIDTQRGLLMINQANANRAEMLLTKLREALGGLEAKLPRTQQSPGSLMTEWLLRGDAAGHFELDCDCELKGLGDAAPVVRISHQDLTAEEVVNLVKNGKVVTQLGLCWQDRVRFVLTQDFTLKRIQFLDVIQEEAAGQGDDMQSITFASQILMAEALGDLLAELVHHLGGWLPE
ncbi:recombination-associated protein RdgC [Snodgrassella alvi]|uniref:Recombination-associated protein RdgC n=1 Tax=Snodgrassella alvi TaxID=1196083 RepID=A0ABD7Z416_9NEIS|nr:MULTISPECIES: recombination-associated protein RdgC [Snodgrassella]AHN27953.1 DNA recombination-dependent growth factor C [Snodgrassella alvi wkB2]MBI0067927.1 recombination-associated protein RdgC [Snodgrassella sp. M0110]MBI0076926.1 recombination-associated protein RdgC [Snodgrassella sp. M0118]MBI0079227.1 recombination-associated protein RdgC [Snodgrassella sp. M0112]MBI0098259.1 recombination-associated protein RdgC [Snodgrassella sp. W8134]